MKIRVQCKKHDAAVEGRPFFFEEEGDEEHPDIPVWHVDTSDMWCPAFDEEMKEAPKSVIERDGGIYPTNEYHEFYDKHDCVGDWIVRIYAQGIDHPRRFGTRRRGYILNGMEVTVE